MKKLVLSKFEKHSDMTTVRFDCDFFVTTAGDGLWGCEAGRKVRVFTIDVTTQAFENEVDVQVSVGDPYNVTYNIRVEIYDNDADIWRLWHGFNSLSDDYAYTNAREAAGRAIKEVAREVAAGER